MDIIKNFHEAWYPFATLESGALFKQGSEPSFDVYLKLPETIKAVSTDIIYNCYNLDKNTFYFVNPDRVVIPLKGTLTVEVNFEAI